MRLCISIRDRVRPSVHKSLPCYAFSRKHQQSHWKMVKSILGVFRSFHAWVLSFSWWFRSFHIHSFYHSTEGLASLQLFQRSSSCSAILVLFYFHFLDASSHLYERVCPSVRVPECPSVRMSVPPLPIQKVVLRTHLIARPGLLASASSAFCVERTPFLFSASPIL